MANIKKIIFFSCLIFIAFVITGCVKDNPPVDENDDTEAPAITVLNGEIKIPVNGTIDLPSLVSVTDNVSATDKIIIEISDYNGFDKSKEGTYEITIKATDEAGNYATVKITVEVVDDMLAPTLTGNITPINHLAGEVVDLTKGLTGVDNKDGINVTFKVTDYGTYDKDVPGSYVIKFVISDSAGNESAPYNRTVVVSNSFSRAEMVSFAGDVIRFKALYNPQVFNGNTGTGYNSAYDGNYVNVLSKDYYEWLLQYAPERLGSGVGWSIVAVTDANDKIVYVRHWSSGEAFLDDQGQLVSQKATDWSTGTVATWNETINDRLVTFSNAKYSSGEMGLMLANLDKWIPEDGHVFVFMNWTTIGLDENDNVVTIANASDMARAMGANYIMNSDENGDDVMDYALGRDLKIVDPQLSDQTARETYDPENPFPVISIPGIKYLNSAGIWKNSYTDVVYLNDYTAEHPYNPLLGVTANDGKGSDITANLTYKVYKYTTSQLKYNLFPSIPITSPLWDEYFEDTYKLSENEISLENALVPSNDQYYFVVEYTVSANGHTDKAYRLIQVQAQKPDYIELYDSSDSVYSKVMGLEQRLEMNPDLDEFGAMDQTDKGILYDATTFKSLEVLPSLPKGLVVVLDSEYRVQLIRVVNGVVFEVDGNGVVKTTELSWTSSDLLGGLKDVVKDGGYVAIYPEGKDSAVLNKALKAFYDYDFDGTEITTVALKNGLVDVEFVIKQVQEVSTLLVNGTAPKVNINNNDVTIAVIENSKDSLVFQSAGGGAGFRLDIGKAYYYTKDVYATLVSSTDVVSSFTTASPNKGVPWFRDGSIVVLDASGNFVLARIMTTAACAEVKADGTVIYGNGAAIATTEAAQTAAGTNNLTWDLVIPNAANAVAHGPLADIQSVIPDGGSFFILPGTANTAVRTLSVQLLWNSKYTGGIIVDGTLSEQPQGNPDPTTNGFDFTNYDANYFANLKVEVQFVSTVTDKPAKLARPQVTVDTNTLTWAPVTGAASYDVYVNGSLAKQNVGVLSEDQTKYTFDLGLLDLAVGDYTIQLRAISDTATASTSVLSDAKAYSCARLSDPTNFVLNDNVLTWDAVEGATKYLVAIEDGEYFEVTTNEATIPDASLVDGTVVKVMASGSETLLNSLAVEYTLSIEVIAKEITFGSYTLPIKEFTVNSWMRYVANDGSAQLVEGLVVINGAEEIANLADDAVLINGGYVVLLDANFTAKYYADRWTHQWDSTTGWTQQTAVSPWAWGLNLKASYLKPYLAQGDILLIGSQYGTGLAEGNYRNILGNVFLKDQGSAVLTSANDHRVVTDFSDVIEPSTVKVEIREKVLTKTISLGNNDLPLVEFSLESWLRYAAADGGNDVGAHFVNGIVLVTGANGIANLTDDTAIFAGGYVAVLGSDMKVKYFADRWTHEWNATTGWTQQTTVSPWAWGATMKASYFKPYLAEGDMLIMGSQYSGGIPAGTYRNYMGNALIKDLGTVTTDHRNVAVADCIDLSKVTISFKETAKVLTIGTTLLDFNEFDVATWMNYASATGGNDVGAANIAGLVYINNAYQISTLADTDKLFAGGYAALLGSDMKVKYYVDRWGHEWNATNGWTTNAAGWPYGANFFASYFKPYLAEGDVLICASQYGKGLIPSATYRNILGNLLLKNQGSAILTSANDHRTVTDFTDAIDPSTVTIVINEL